MTKGLTSDSLALDSTGSRAWAWGFNGNGELGDGTTTGPDSCYSDHPCSLTPVPVSMPGGVIFTSVSAGNSVSVALDSTGHAWAWGFDSDGELGDGTTTDSSIPVAVSMPPGVTFGQITAGGEAVLALPLGSKCQKRKSACILLIYMSNEADKEPDKRSV